MAPRSVWRLMMQNYQRSLAGLIQSQDLVLRDALIKASRSAGQIISGLPGNGVGVAIRRAFYAQRQLALSNIAVELWDDIPRTIRGNLDVAAQLAANANRQVLSVLTRATPGYAAILADSMLHSAGSTFFDVQSRIVNEIDLSPSVYKNRALMTGKIDDLVNTGIALGQSAREIADAVIDHINPSVVGGQRYAAHRLGRTELNNAFHTTSRATYQESPYVKGVVWNLSGSHEREDECDDWDGEIFEKGEVPDKPHPQCFCYLTPVTPTPEEFADRMTSGEYDCGGL